mmetsp:Transcript_24745/g.55890  ORF Transcript_24745/g.55890 Transcript_24745/m.55890 type:complete len:334 (-) Transcript_24745:195-1196(-)
MGRQCMPNTRLFEDMLEQDRALQARLQQAMKHNQQIHLMLKQEAQLKLRPTSRRDSACVSAQVWSPGTRQARTHGWTDQAKLQVASVAPQARFLAETFSSRLRRERPKSAEPVREASLSRSRCSSASQSPRSGPTTPRSKSETPLHRREAKRRAQLKTSKTGARVFIIPPQGGLTRNAEASRDQGPKAPPPSPGAAVPVDKVEGKKPVPLQPLAQEELRQARQVDQADPSEEELASQAQAQYDSCEERLAADQPLLPSCKPLSPIREVSENVTPKARERSRGSSSEGVARAEAARKLQMDSMPRGPSVGGLAAPQLPSRERYKLLRQAFLENK